MFVKWVNFLLLETVNMVKKHVKQCSIIVFNSFAEQQQKVRNKTELWEFADNRGTLLAAFVDIRDFDQG